MYRISRKKTHLQTFVNVCKHALQGGFPVLIDSRRLGVGKAFNTNWSASSNIAIPRDGGPLSHFLGDDTSTDEKVIPSVTYSNPPSPVVPVMIYFQQGTNHYCKNRKD